MCLVTGSPSNQHTGPAHSYAVKSLYTLQWRHNECNGVSNHQPHHCLLNSGADQRKHQNSASLAFVRGIDRWPVNSPHKWPVMQKIFPFVHSIMTLQFFFKHTSGMMILLNDWSVGDHGFWGLMIHHENWWSIIFDHETSRPVRCEIVDIYIFYW